MIDIYPTTGLHRQRREAEKDIPDMRLSQL
jgi:hypothetical protein